MIHVKIYGAFLSLLIILFFGIMLDSTITPGLRMYFSLRQADFRILPSADPGMDTSARYIRHLGLSTPGSAFPDYPGQPDYLPSGMMWPPPAHFVGLNTLRPLFDSPESADGETHK